MNANEAPQAIGAGGAELHRYPELRPQRLQRRLARHYGVPPQRLLVTRGSSEAIDLLIRAFCRPGRDEIALTRPTFSMYRVYADIQGVAAFSVPLRAEDDFVFDVDALLRACSTNTKLIFVCSPNNPTGTLVPRAGIVALAEARQGKSLIVVDEAYVEFSGAASLAALTERYENLVVLRTLSKALALAGARCGAVVAAPEVLSLLDGILAPYALATPVVECVLGALAPARLHDASAAIERIVGERERLAAQLGKAPLVARVWPSRANFLLVQFRDIARVRQTLREQRILIRELEADTALPQCARITVGTHEENERLLAAIVEIREVA